MRFGQPSSPYSSGAAGGAGQTDPSPRPPSNTSPWRQQKQADLDRFFQPVVPAPGVRHTTLRRGESARPASRLQDFYSRSPSPDFSRCSHSPEESPPPSPPTHAALPFSKVKESARIHSVFCRSKDAYPFVIVAEVGEDSTTTRRVGPFHGRGFKGHPRRDVRSAPPVRKPPKKPKPPAPILEIGQKRRVPRLCNKFGQCHHHTPTRSLAGIIPEHLLIKSPPPEEHSYTPVHSKKIQDYSALNKTHSPQSKKKQPEMVEHYDEEEGQSAYDEQHKKHFHTKNVVGLTRIRAISKIQEPETPASTPHRNYKESLRNKSHLVSYVHILILFSRNI